MIYLKRKTSKKNYRAKLIFVYCIFHRDEVILEKYGNGKIIFLICMWLCKFRDEFKNIVVSSFLWNSYRLAYRSPPRFPTATSRKPKRRCSCTALSRPTRCPPRSSSTKMPQINEINSYRAASSQTDFYKRVGPPNSIVTYEFCGETAEQVILQISAKNHPFGCFIFPVMHYNNKI